MISRSELLKAFNSKNVQITFNLPVEEVLGEDVDLDDFAMLVQDAIQAYKKMVIDTIKTMPTAYSVDKVVERLNRETISSSIKESLGLLKAIEIVKQGGVSDDVCEWKYDDDNLTTSCGDYFNLYDNCTEKFKYCPVCGKKIKVVEQ